MSFKIVDTKYFRRGSQADITEFEENNDIDTNQVEVYYDKNQKTYFTRSKRLRR